MAVSSSTTIFVVCLLLKSVVFVAGLFNSSTFDSLYQPTWALDHFSSEGDIVHMKLDNQSGAGFQSKSKYMFGKVSIRIKLVAGDSAGTVTAFYMSSDGPKHNEFDFEFLGNTTGEPYLVQTNLYINGVGGREQRLNLWFDPTTDFHSYSILWNSRHVLFLVDETPVRVYANMENEGIPFPKGQPMGIYSSIWNADDWATQGGRIKTNWTQAPFVASYTGFEIDACECPTSEASEENIQRCTSGGDKKFWWDEPVVMELNVHQTHQLLWVKANHMVYDYCTDKTRNAVQPKECLHRRH